MQLYKKEQECKTVEKLYKDDCHVGGYGGQQHYKEEKHHLQNGYSAPGQHSSYNMSSSSNQYSGAGGMPHGGVGMIGGGGHPHGHGGHGYGGHPHGHGGHGYGGHPHGHGGHGYGGHPHGYGGHHQGPSHCAQKPLWNFKGVSD